MIAEIRYDRRNDRSGRTVHYQVSFTGPGAGRARRPPRGARPGVLLRSEGGIRRSTTAAQPSVVPPGESESTASAPPAPTSTTIATPPGAKSLDARSGGGRRAAAPGGARPPAGSAGVRGPRGGVAARTGAVEDRNRGRAGPAGGRQASPQLFDETGRRRRRRSPRPGPRRRKRRPRPRPPRPPPPKPGRLLRAGLSTTSKTGGDELDDEALVARNTSPRCRPVDRARAKLYRVRVGPYADKRAGEDAGGEDLRRVPPDRLGRPPRNEPPGPRRPRSRLDPREEALACRELHEIKSAMRRRGLHTVCEEARCPNRRECFCARDGDVPPARRRLHARVRLLRHRGREGRRSTTRTSRRTRRGSGPGDGAQVRRRDLGRPRRPARRRLARTSRRRSGRSARSTPALGVEVLTPDFRGPPRVRRGRRRRGRTSSTTTSRPFRGSTAGPARREDRPLARRSLRGEGARPRR